MFTLLTKQCNIIEYNYLVDCFYAFNYKLKMIQLHLS